jgi:hypothetical protein
VSDENLDSAAPESVDQPDNQVDAPGAPDQADKGSAEESFTDFDASSIPESGASPQWLKERYDQMNRDYTQKMQEFGETRRTKDELQTIIDTLRQGDAEQRRATATMLGLTEDDVLQMFNLERAEEEAAAEAEAQEPELDDLDFKDPRVDRIIAREEAEAQQAEAKQREAEADEEADAIGSEMEGQLKEALGDDVDEKVSKWIFAQALDNPDQFGKPDVIGAVAEWKELVEAQVQERMDSRMGPRATTPGIPGSERFDKSTDEGRIALGAQAAREARSAAR